MSCEALTLRARGAIRSLDDDTRRVLLTRAASSDAETAESVAALLRDVEADGDDALRKQTARFDGVELDAIEIPNSVWAEALGGLDPDVRNALERAAANIASFHAALLPTDVSVDVEPGVRITRRWLPLERVGVYAPGGTAAYPSSVLMGAVPARASGVGEVVVCSPPGPSGHPPEAVMAACAIAGVDRLFAIGGAGAIGALAYGTESVPAVDTIVGPGNRWVTEAKRQIAGRVPIDGPAGPSEVLVLADASSDPRLVAAEVLAQAEHDPDAACVVVTTSAGAVSALEWAIHDALEAAPRAGTAGRALAENGAVLVATDLDEAIAFTDAYAPEHLSVMTENASDVAARVRNAGTTFVGPHASVAFGDYITGANHVLPTAGRARSFSGLSTAHFLRSFTVQEIDKEGAASLADDVALLADVEGLPAHAAAARIRGGSR